MLNETAISQQLLKLANPQLTVTQQQSLLKIIQRLFADLASGHSCSLVSQVCADLELNRLELKQLMQNSDLTVFYMERPTKLIAKPLSYVQTSNDDLIYISKYLAYELNVATQVLNLSNDVPSDENETNLHDALNKLEQLSIRENKPNAEQLAAIKQSCHQKFSIISGGPGTGKTTTVTLLLWVLYQVYGNELQVQICAPTGKAAVRVRESIENSIHGLSSATDLGITTECFDTLLNTATSFGTLHKLLGYIHHQIHFRHNQNNRLNCEVLIIDESSMVGLPLFSKLLMAVNQQKIHHIIFLGDRNQLSSVEEGYVFASLVNLRRIIYDDKAYDLFAQTEKLMMSELKISNRNKGEIYQLAQAILNQNTIELNTIITNAKQIKVFAPQLSLALKELINSDGSALVDYIDFASKLELNKLDIKQLFRVFTHQAVLCLTNRGVLGANNINLQIERKIKQLIECSTEWYNGRPIIILQNDYSLEVFNGDIGICICDGDLVNIVFENGRQFIPEVLPQYAVAYAITIHKSQGSEYDQVNLLLPDFKLDDDLDSATILSRELVYTAITRARTKVNLFANLATIEQSVMRNMQRNSGLDYFLHTS